MRTISPRQYCALPEEEKKEVIRNMVQPFSPPPNATNEFRIEALELQLKEFRADLDELEDTVERMLTPAQRRSWGK